MSWASVILIILYLIFEDHVFHSEHGKKVVKYIFIGLLVFSILDLLIS